MTTIAFDGEVIAADTLCVSGYVRTGEMEKITQVPGALIGFSGDACAMAAFTRWYREGRNGEYPSSSEFHALVLTPDGCGIYEPASREPIPVHPPVAIGSGREFALAVMDLGGNAQQAVCAAIKRDIYSGGEVRYSTLAELRSLSDTTSGGTGEGGAPNFRGASIRPGSPTSSNLLEICTAWQPVAALMRIGKAVKNFLVKKQGEGN